MERLRFTSFMKLAMLLLTTIRSSECIKDLLEILDETREPDLRFDGDAEGAELLEMMLQALPDTERNLDAPEETPCTTFVKADIDQSQHTHAMRLFLAAIRTANADLTSISCLSATTQARTIPVSDAALWSAKWAGPTCSNCLLPQVTDELVVQMKIQGFKKGVRTVRSCRRATVRAGWDAFSAGIPCRGGAHDP